jgi:OTU domain-containing protein 6
MESLSKLRQRHKTEMHELAKLAKAEAAKGGKAEKRAAKERFEKAEQALAAKHAAELEALRARLRAEGAGSDADGDGDGGGEHEREEGDEEVEEEEEQGPEAGADESGRASNGAAEQPAESAKQVVESADRQRDAAAEDGADHAADDAPKFKFAQKKLSKGQKKRSARQKEEVQREQRVAEEKKSVVDPRSVENGQLAEQLGKDGMRVKEIASDGNCLFRAIADQLEHRGTCGLQLPRPAHVMLRRMAADYIRTHPDEFLPFLTDAEGNPMDRPQLEKYCTSMSSEEKALWGGHTEIAALAAALNRRIVVHSARAVPLQVGAAPADASRPPLHVSFHRHYLGLGEHYNSVVSAPPAAIEAGSCDA